MYAIRSYYAGLRTGDKIITVDGEQPETFTDMVTGLIYGGEVKVDRNGKDTSIFLPTNFAEQLIDKSIYDKGIMLLYPRIPFIVVEVPEGSQNYGSGLQAKDRFLQLAGKPVKYVDQVTAILDSTRNQTIPRNNFV